MPCSSARACQWESRVTVRGGARGEGERGEGGGESAREEETERNRSGETWGSGFHYRSESLPRRMVPYLESASQAMNTIQMVCVPT